MACGRCGGLTVREQAFDPTGTDPSDRGDAERCVNCGALEDAIILANRNPAHTLSHPRGPRAPHDSSYLRLCSDHWNQTGPPQSILRPAAASSATPPTTLSGGDS